MDPIIIASLIAAASQVGSTAISNRGGQNDDFMQMPRLNKRQRGIEKGLYNAVEGEGAGGAFGEAADYYRSLLNPNNDTFNSLQAPEMRQFNEQIIPDLSEQFAGMGSGGLSSSGFRNAAVNAGADLSERLGAIRANLRSQGAQGLLNLGNTSLSEFNQNVYRPPYEGGWEDAAAGLTNAGTQLASDYLRQPTENTSAPISTPTASSKLPGFSMNPSQQAMVPVSGKGKSSPYGNKPLSSQIPGMGGSVQSKINLPSFGVR